MKWVIGFFVAASFQMASAHIEKGIHQGQTATGEVCSLSAGEQIFLNDQAHPLNERVHIQIGGDAFLVGHPPVVDAEKAIAHFNHDLFQAVLATSTGAKALIIEMVHTESKEGPESYTLITHDWKTGASSKLVCSGLRFQK